MITNTFLLFGFRYLDMMMMIMLTMIITIYYYIITIIIWLVLLLCLLLYYYYDTIIYHYQYYSQGAGDGNFHEVYTGLNRNFQVTGLKASTRYVFRLAAQNALGMR